MLRLKDRQKQIPNGFKFYLPELKWSAPGNYPSFDRIVSELERLVNANPFIAQKNNWPATHKAIEDWVDSYNSALCAKMGWDDYITSDQGPSVPKSMPRHQQQSLQNLRAAAAGIKELVAGAKSLTEWIDSGEPAVVPALSLHRAIICSQCPKNEAGDFTKWFTVPASELIKRQVQKAEKRQLTTLRDDQLHVCTACHCPLKLKVHVPLEWITKRLTDEQRKRLAEGRNCWILSGS